MNVEERSLVKGALSILVNDANQDREQRLRVAAGILRDALEVRKPLTVCEVCHRIGGCDHVRNIK